MTEQSVTDSFEIRASGRFIQDVFRARDLDGCGAVAKTDRGIPYCFHSASPREISPLLVIVGNGMGILASYNLC